MLWMWMLGGLGATSESAFFSLPVQEGGRIKPLGSVARSTLLILGGKERLKDAQGQPLSAQRFALDMFLAPERARTYPVFRVDHAQVKRLLGVSKKFVTFEDVQPHLEALQARVNALPEDEQLRNAFENQLVKLFGALKRYLLLERSLVPVDLGLDASNYTKSFQQTLSLGVAALQAQEQGRRYDEQALQRFVFMTHELLRWAEAPSPLGVLPPGVVDLSTTAPGADPEAWTSLPLVLTNQLFLKSMPVAIEGYWEAAAAHRAGDPQAFAAAVAKLEAFFKKSLSAGELRTLHAEQAFNQLDPFYWARVLYLMVFVLSALFWLWPKSFLWRISHWGLSAGLALHSFGLLARMYISGRPPITNLYSSALFVGWTAVLVAWLLEPRQRQALTSCVGAIIGFSTLWIAKALGASGDTLELLRAVLDTNFWLGTHVVMVNLGYGAAFLAGTLSVLVLLKAAFQRSHTDLKLAERRVYGLVCFGLLLSFIGTLLGGIWADQSWGRFWGWDPKENGALLIVLWLALLLHARWGRLVSPRGFLILSIGCNIVTSWSWFGTNMLGVGLHTYGFTQSAFPYLAAFALAHLGFMCLGKACAGSS